MRILFLDQFSDFGGAQLCLRDVLLEVKERGWQAEVIAPGTGPLLDFARECGFAAGSLPLGRYRNGHKSVLDVFRYGIDITRSARLIRSILRECPADLIYVNGPRLLPALPGAGAAVLFHTHSVAGKRYAETIASRSLRRVRARVLACSEFAARPLRKRLAGNPVRVVYNGVPDQGFAPRVAGQGPLRVGIIGRIAPEKGHLDFLRAAAFFAMDSPASVSSNSARFSITGAALFSDASFERSVRIKARAAGVEFCGWTDAVSQTLHALDIVAVPSAAHDASPRVVLEALSAGTCVVAYPSGGIPELIRDGHSGLLTKTSSHEELAALIRALAANPELRRRLAWNGRREWEARFRVERFRSEVCNAISGAATSQAPAAIEMRSTSPERTPARDEELSAP